MIQYYLDLISKPKYMLSEAESMFIAKELQMRKLYDKEEDSNEQDL